jgi:hypothetical protein
VQLAESERKWLTELWRNGILTGSTEWAAFKAVMYTYMDQKVSRLSGR